MSIWMVRIIMLENWDFLYFEKWKPKIIEDAFSSNVSRHADVNNANIKKAKCKKSINKSREIKTLEIC